MILPLLILFAFALAIAVTLTTFVQLLYMESMRLRAHSCASLDFFKETVEERIGLRDEDGALAFSLLKHGCLLALGAVLYAISLRGVTTAMWQAMLETLLLGGFGLLGTAYIIPQLLFAKLRGSGCSQSSDC